MAAVVRYREFWGAEKRAELLQSLDEDGAAFDGRYEVLAPNTATRFAMRPGSREANFEDWTPLADLSAANNWSGLLEKRKGALIAHDRAELEARFQRYADPEVAFATLKAEGDGPVEDAARFVAETARRNLLAAGGYTAGTIRRITLLPFDNRWCFHTDIRPLWNEPRPEVAAQQAAGASFLVTRGGCRRDPFGFPTFHTKALPGDYLLDPNSHPFPNAIHPVSVGGIPARNEPPRSNLSPAALAWITAVGLPPNAESSRLVWHHALAITYSPAYLAENAAGIRQGWPRVPLPGDAEALRASAALGQRLAALLDADAPVPGVTEGALAPALAAIAIPSTRPGAARDWRCTNWGNATKTGIMPGRGHVSARPYGVGEEATAAQAALLGATTQDIGLNGASYWKNIPEKVWEVHIGGYQVLKKWLSYRDGSILQRALTPEEVAHVQATARRLAAILLMGPELDASFRACAAAHVALKAP
jgi:hypothetical protein